MWGFIVVAVFWFSLGLHFFKDGHSTPQATQNSVSFGLGFFLAGAGYSGKEGGWDKKGCLTNPNHYFKISKQILSPSKLL